MKEELEILKDVAKHLDRAGVQYMITGSMALAFYSTPRMTRDIDVVLEVNPANVKKLIDQFRADYFIDELGIQTAVLEKNMFNIIHKETVIKIDFITKKNEEYRHTEFSRRQEIEISGHSICVVSPEDLLLSKLVWAKDSESGMQLKDARSILHSRPKLDREYICKWAEILRVKEMLQKAESNE